MSARKPWEHAKSTGSESDPSAARFVSSLDVDQRLYRHDIRGSVAHARMLERVGLISADELARIERGLAEIEGEIDAQGDGWPGWRVELEDVHMCIEAALIEKAGDAGRKLHTGRSRNDQVAADLKLWLDEAAGGLARDRFGPLRDAFVELAQRDGDIVMPAYTHLQRAQPIVAGGEIGAWIGMFDGCADRFFHLACCNAGNPLGSGAIAGSGLPLDRAAVTEALGIGPTSTNSIWATASRDAAVDFTYAAAMTAMALSRWAEQWIIYASTEFDFITLDERYTTGSSMMPQKRNPDMLELIRGRTGGVYGNLVALLTMLKAQPIGYNRDMQEDKRHLFAAHDSVRDCLEIAAGIVGSTSFNREKIEATLDRGYLDATSLAEYLVTRDVPFRSAHQMVGRLVQLCEAEGLGALGRLSVERFNAVCGADVCGDDVYDWLGASNVVRRYRTAGNAGATGFGDQLAEWKDRKSAGDR